MSSNRIYSGIVTSACQTCNIPPKCTHEATIYFASETDSYRQDPDFFKRYDYLIEPKNGNEAPLTLTVKSKRCISNSPHCPTGNIFREDGSLFGEFNPEKAFNGALPYTGNTGGFSYDQHNPIDILANLITRKGLTNDPRYRQSYKMRLAECGGGPFITLPQAIQVGAAVINPVTHGLPTLYIEGKRHLASARFNLILYRELTASVSIGFESKLEKKEKAEIRKNAKTGQRPGKNGWTKHTDKYQIKKSVTIEGEILSVIGSDRYGYTKELKQAFTKDKNKLSLLDCIDAGFNTINSALQKGKDKEPFPLVNAEFLYPKLQVEGSLKTDMSKANQVINRGEIIVGFAPFFGFKITVDLLTALARFMKAYGHFLNVARAAAESQEKAVKDGETGVYAILKLELMFSFAMHGFYEFKTDDEGSFNSTGRDVELYGEIIGDMHIEAGINIFGTSGFFKAGAEVKSTLKMDFDKNEGDDLTAVIYHEGIKAKVYVNKSKDAVSESIEEGLSSDSATDGEYEEWVIYDELPKEKSDWKFKMG